MQAPRELGYKRFLLHPFVSLSASLSPAGFFSRLVVVARLAGAAGLGIAGGTGCAGAASAPPPAPTTASLYACPKGRTESWRGTFETVHRADWLAGWGRAARVLYGDGNMELGPEPDVGTFLRVRYPAGSSSSKYAKEGHPVGGLEFKAKLPPADSLYFAYWVRFAPNFPWVKGGKLPGVCGGSCPSGGKLVTGLGGWSMRLMWRPGGQGEEYAYILPARRYGTELGLGEWSFARGGWHRVVVEVALNAPGANDGSSRVWYDADPDGPPSFSAKGLTFRKDATPADTLFFSTFFGGHDATWATPVDTYADFAGFVVCR